MVNYFLKRLFYMIIVLYLVSIASFYIVNLPPGSWIESYAIELDNSGEMVDEEELIYLTERYGLDQPIHIQYLRWIIPILTKGDFGQSFEWQMPVWNLIEDRLLLAMIISTLSLLFIYIVKYLSLLPPNKPVIAVFIVPYFTAIVPEAEVDAIPPIAAFAPGSIGKKTPSSLK